MPGLFSLPRFGPDNDAARTEAKIKCGDPLPEYAGVETREWRRRPSREHRSPAVKTPYRYCVSDSRISCPQEKPGRVA